MHTSSVSRRAQPLYHQRFQHQPVKRNTHCSRKRRKKNTHKKGDEKVKSSRRSKVAIRRTKILEPHMRPHIPRRKTWSCMAYNIPLPRGTHVRPNIRLSHLSPPPRVLACTWKEKVKVSKRVCVEEEKYISMFSRTDLYFYFLWAWTSMSKKKNYGE